MKPQPLPIGTTVEFDICEGMNVGRGIIFEADYDDGWIYRIDVSDGDPADSHRNQNGELWVLDTEVSASDLQTN